MADTRVSVHACLDKSGVPPLPLLTLCMIVRDEARFLPGCLASVQDVVDEVVVVDTGSQDETMSVAQAAGARVVRFPWNDDFSAARKRGPCVGDRSVHPCVGCRRATDLRRRAADPAGVPRGEGRRVDVALTQRRRSRCRPDRRGGGQAAKWRRGVFATLVAADAGPRVGGRGA